MPDPTQEPYPETIPEVLPFEGDDTFTFNMAAGDSAVKDIEQEISSLEERIARLARRKEVQVNGVPVLQHLIGLTQDRDELRNIGKALIRVAELTPRLQELYKRKSVIEMARDNPRWMMATFADFSDEVESLVNNDTDIEG